MHMRTPNSRYKRFNSSEQHQIASTQDWCYLALLFVIVTSLATGISTLGQVDRTKAYAGGVFLFIFLLLFAYAFSTWWCSSQFSSIGYALTWFGTSPIIDNTDSLDTSAPIASCPTNAK